MRRLLLSLILLSLMSVSYAANVTIQRYHWIGVNKEGTIVAVMLSYFGPASQAPVARIVVKEVGKTEPLYEDGAVKLSGNEKDLAELCTYLLNNNIDKLKSFGIKLSNSAISEAYLAFAPNVDPSVVSGWIGIENDGSHEFEIKSDASNSCPSNLPGKVITIAFDGIKRLTIHPGPDTCGDDSFHLRNVFRTKKALWFILSMHAYGLAGQETFWIDVQGISMYQQTSKNQ